MDTTYLTHRSRVHSTSHVCMVAIPQLLGAAVAPRLLGGSGRLPASTPVPWLRYSPAPCSWRSCAALTCRIGCQATTLLLTSSCCSIALLRANQRRSTLIPARLAHGEERLPFYFKLLVDESLAVTPLTPAQYRHTGAHRTMPPSACCGCSTPLPSGQSTRALCGHRSHHKRDDPSQMAAALQVLYLGCTIHSQVAYEYNKPVGT